MPTQLGPKGEATLEVWAPVVTVVTQVTSLNNVCCPEVCLWGPAEQVLVVQPEDVKGYLPDVVFCLLFIFIFVINLKEYKIDKDQEVNIKGHIVCS